MKIVKKIPYIILPFVIWLTILIYMLLHEFIASFVTINSPHVAVLIIVLIFNFIFQVAVVSIFTSIAVKKFELNLKSSFLALPVMYLLFAIYAHPSLYLFIFTDEWSGFWLQYQPPMPFWEASLFITLQYGIIMLITTLIATAKNKKSKSN